MGSVPCDKKRLYIHTLHRPSAKKLNFLLICTTTRHKLYSSQTERQTRIN